MTGQTYIIIKNEALYYGTKLYHLLINPNQIQSYYIPFWYNPYDKEKGLIIKVDDTVFIPMHTSGTKVLFKTRSI